MLTFSFWNLKKRPLQALIAAFAEQYKVDVLTLAECTITREVLLRELNTISSLRFSLAFSPSQRVIIYTRFPSTWLKPIKDVGGLSIRRLLHPLYSEILLVAAHLSSKLYRTSEEQTIENTWLRGHIEQAEHEVGHARTVILGDLNMNPFEPGMVAANAFHGIMDRRIVARQTRMVQGEERRFFYNPMWARLGDEPPGPPGTYYYNTSSQINYFWNIFDQVLIRPDLLSAFRNEELEVVTQIGSTSLLSANGLPNTAVASDHLPLMFKLHL